MLKIFAGKTKLRVIYLGGMYHAEYSILQSFHLNGAKIIFPIDSDSFPYWSNLYFGKHNQSDYVFNVSKEKLKELINIFNPHAIIHRYYMDNPCMHHNSYQVARECGVPLIRYIAETDYNDNKSLNGNEIECDVLLYSHDSDYFKENVKNIKKPSFFFPYGVSGAESFKYENRDLAIGTLGYFRDNYNNRGDDLKLFIDSTLEKINVYGNWDNYNYINKVNVNRNYMLEELGDQISKHKILINFESCPDMNGVYSYKMFQGLGYGVPTITRYKKNLENIFGDSPKNLIMYKDKDEIKYWINKLLTDERMLKRYSRHCYQYIQKHLNWYDRLFKIFKKINII